MRDIDKTRLQDAFGKTAAERYESAALSIFGQLTDATLADHAGYCGCFETVIAHNRPIIVPVAGVPWTDRGTRHECFPFVATGTMLNSTHWGDIIARCAIEDGIIPPFH